MSITYKHWSILIISICILIFSNCHQQKSGVHIPDEPFEHLSEYGFFTGPLADLSPSDGVLPYDLNSPLFSDYAHKARFVWMPDGTSASYNTEHTLDFPVGAVLIKNFYYNNDESNPSLGRRMMETRLLINRGEEWDAYGYIWDESQSDAYYEVIGDIKKVTWNDKDGITTNVDYIIPNKNQCKGCHAYKNKLKPIGPKIRNLNKTYAYNSGEQNQLAMWSEMGYLKGWTKEINAPSVAIWNDSSSYNIHERSMAYLDINCGHCHNPDGAANTSGLTLLADSPLDMSLGIYKATVSAGAGTGGHTYSIVPGESDKSIMIYRMKSDNPGAMMPEIGRRLVHTEGVALIEEWINSMDINTIKASESLN